MLQNKPAPEECMFEIRDKKGMKSLPTDQPVLQRTASAFLEYHSDLRV